jgi:hypothetical protein
MTIEEIFKLTLGITLAIAAHVLSKKDNNKESNN